MVDRPTRDRTTSGGKEKEVLDPISGRPLTDYLLNPLVDGPEVEAEEMEDDITGPEDLPKPPRERSARGVQLIAHVESSDDISEMLPKLRSAWRQARKDLGLDD